MESMKICIEYTLLVERFSQSKHFTLFRFHRWVVEDQLTWLKNHLGGFHHELLSTSITITLIRVKILHPFKKDLSERKELRSTKAIQKEMNWKWWVKSQWHLDVESNGFWLNSSTMCFDRFSTACMVSPYQLHKNISDPIPFHQACVPLDPSNIRWLLSEPHKQQLLIKPPLWFFCWPCIRTYCLDLSVYYLWISSLPFLSRFSNYVFCFATSSIRFFGIFVEWPMVTSLPCEPGYRWEHQHFQLQLCWILKDPQQHSARLRPSVERMAQKTPAAFWMEDNLRPPPSRYSRSIIKIVDHWRAKSLSSRLAKLHDPTCGQKDDKSVGPWLWIFIFMVSNNGRHPSGM